MIGGDSSSDGVRIRQMLQRSNTVVTERKRGKEGSENMEYCS